ncbi:MAG: transposase [Proteobacteria bacterium]|nr:transposase [Pseudomonadota bacterium]
MPRRARIIIPNMPHHIFQRGFDLREVFVNRAAYAYYLNNLREWTRKLGIKVYGYCLMTDRVHLIIEPGDQVASVSELMKRLAAGQTRYINSLTSRIGPLWASRYKISAIDREDYLLECCRYIELNPVLARIVNRAEDWEWSSYRSRIGIGEASWLECDSTYLALGSGDEERRKRYREFIAEGVGNRQEIIKNALGRNQLTGSRRFIDEVELRMGVRVEYRGRGRPGPA